MKTELILEKTLPNKQAIKAVVSTKKNHFSITGYLGEIVRGRNIDPIIIAGKKYFCFACGCIHNEIKEAFRQLEKFIPLHLSNLDGVPTYAFENGLYWTQQDKPEVLSRHLRINIDEATNLCELAKEATKDDFLPIFTMFVELQKERWRKEADEFIEFIQNN